MNPNFSPIVRLAALSVCALGAFVLTGWGLGSREMVRILPDSVAMSINTAVLFLVAGILLLSSERQGPRARRLAGVLSWVLVLFPAAILVQHLFDVDLGIDWAEVHRRLVDGHSKPGRTSPNACLGFLAAGIFFRLDLARSRRPGAHRAAQVLAWLVFLIGLTGAVGYFLDLEALYQFASYNRMAAFTALGMTGLGIGLVGLQVRNRPEDSAAATDDAAQITGLAASLLTVLALATGASALGAVKSSYEKSAAENIWRTARARASGAAALIDVPILLSRNLARGPELRASLLALAERPGEAQARERLRQEAEGFLAWRTASSRSASSGRTGRRWCPPARRSSAGRWRASRWRRRKAATCWCGTRAMP
ncbi:hypothetical protein [Caldimonas tepidiphila]|uniref:hypothetical protein n=1 Tax=Caldimonas tepidiphila TaxID=2315841 RepID=UPI000E5B16E9|nr:hypothetical protein [Caldimonas tepidiphila]